MEKQIKRLVGGLVLVLSVLISLPVMAASTWQQTGGPVGGQVNFLVIDPTTPQTIYSGTYDGVFKSIDGGASWSPVNNGLTSTMVSSLVMDSTSTQTLYAGMWFRGVFKSTNGGGSWCAVNTGLPETEYISLAIDPANHQTLYAGTDSGVFKSVNGGNSWSAVNTGLPSTTIRSLAIDPSHPQTVYAGTWGEGVFKSTNGGGSWSAINNGLTDLIVLWYLAVNPSNPQILYVETYSGVFKSTDGGSSWKGGLAAFPMAFGPNDPQTLYAGTFAGVLLSTDGGNSWNEVSTGLPETDVNSLAIDPTAPGTIYAGTMQGVYKSSGGDSWNVRNNGLTNFEIMSLAVDPTAPETVYAGAYAGGVFKTTDSGGSWSRVNNGLASFGFYTIHALAIDPVNPQTIYAGEDYDVFKTTDGGGSWIGLSKGFTFSSSITSLAIDSTNSQTLYAGGHRTVYKSTDGGDTWKEITTGLPDAFVYSLAIDSSNSQTIYAGTGAGVFKSTDGGGSWNGVNTGFPVTIVYSLAIDPTAPQTVYAGTIDNGLFKSIDGGSSWTATNNGLTDSWIISLAIDSATPQFIYAGTMGGVFRSTNGGSSWYAVNSGMVDPRVSALAIDPTNPQTIYAGGAFGGGVYKGSFLPSPTISGTPAAAGTVGTAYSFTPTSVAAASFSITGTIPPGLTFNATTGTLSGIPTTIGNYSNIVISALNENASGVAPLPAFTITVTLPTISIVDTPANPSNSTSASFTFAPASQYYTFECKLDNGSFAACSSPRGYSSLTDGGHTFKVRAVDQAGYPDPNSVTYTWTIDAVPPINGTIVAVPGAGLVNLSWTGFFDPITGIDGYRLVYDTGALPSSCSAGTTIYSGSNAGYVHTGLTKGTTYYYRVCAIDNLANMSSGATASAKIKVASLVVSTDTPLVSGTYGVNYRKKIAATGGYKPYTWSVSSGALPGGVTLDAARGALKGKPTGWGDFTFTVQVVDKLQNTATKEMAMTVAVTPLVISTTSPLASGKSGSAYKKALVAKGGVLPYAWSITSGSLPSGLSLDAATGIVSGISATPGSSSFTMQLMDGRDVAVTKAFILVVK